MKISLITVSFNSAATIRDTFESVLAQSYSDYEYIVIDGLSKDATVDIIKEYEPKFSGRMRWISEKDSGLYDAMNKGIKMATGDVVGILNSDDFFTDSTVLETVNRSFEQNQPDAVYGDVCYVKADNTDILDRYYSSKKFKRWKMRIGLIPAHPTFYAKRELFDKLGVYRTDYKIAADFDLLLRFIFVNKIKTFYIEKCLVTMRSGGVSNGSLKVHTRIMKEHLRSFREVGYHTNVFLLSLRYWGKVYDLLAAKISMAFNKKSLNNRG